MSLEDPKGSEAPARAIPEKDDENDSEGHRFIGLVSDPEDEDRLPSSDSAMADENDDTEGHRFSGGP